MKKFYKATAIMGVSTFVAMIIGLLRAKVIAVTLGPSGMGIFSQATTFFMSAETICGLGIGTGIVKYVSQMWQKKSPDEVKKAVSASFVLQIVSFLIFFVPVLVFSKQISQFVFSTPEYSTLLIIISGAVLFSVLIISLESVLLGLARPDIFSKSRITYYLIGFMLLVLLVGTMKLKGGFIYIAINAVVSLSVVCVFLTRALRSKVKVSLWRSLHGLKKIDFRFYIGKLLSYGVVMLGTAAITWLAILYVRSVLIKEVGTSANGFYQVAFALVGYYAPFFTNGIWGYLFPKLSAIEDVAHFNAEVNKALRFILIFLIPAIAILFLVREPLILIVFSKEFLPALKIFPLYLVGSFFFVVWYTLGTSLLAKKKLKAYFMITIFQHIGYACLFTVLVRRMGFMAIAVSYFGVNMIAGVASSVYQIRRMGFAYNTENIKLFFIGLVFIVIVFFIPLESVAGLTFKIILVISWFLFAIGKKEKALFRSFVRARQLWKRFH